MHSWVEQRFEFFMKELATLLPAKQKRVPHPDERAIVSHKAGRPDSSGQVTGERYS
jgi:hypothetical protein